MRATPFQANAPVTKVADFDHDQIAPDHLDTAQGASGQPIFTRESSLSAYDSMNLFTHCRQGS